MSPWLRSAYCGVYIVLSPTRLSPPVCLEDLEDLEDREGSDWGVVLRTATCLMNSSTSGVFPCGCDLEDGARAQQMSLVKIVRVYIPIGPVSASGLTVIGRNTSFAWGSVAAFGVSGWG
jgi:hypothetical protein